MVLTEVRFLGRVQFISIHLKVKIMTKIWILDCSNGLVTKVNLSKERTEELENMDSYDFLEKYADDFGINFNDSEWMITEAMDEVYEMDF